MAFDVCFEGSSFTEGFITVRANVILVPICSFCICLLERKEYSIYGFCTGTYSKYYYLNSQLNTPALARKIYMLTEEHSLTYMLATSTKTRYRNWHKDTGTGRPAQCAG